MLTPEQMRKADPTLSDTSDEELEELRTALYETAQLAFDVWWLRREGSKNPETTFPVAEEATTL